MSHRDINPFCLSSYLGLRYVARAGEAWVPGVEPTMPIMEQDALLPVASVEEIREALSLELGALEGPMALLLSGGIDSAILAALLPAGTPAYTIRFCAEGAVDETSGAARCAGRADLPLTVIEVTWADYERHLDSLMIRKRSPLHAVEPALYLAARRAVADGARTIVVGNGADSTFGGLDKLLGREWTFESFYQRYTFVPPESALVAPVDLRPVYAEYRQGSDGIEVVAFLRKVHGLGITQAFENAIHASGARIATPYERLGLSVPLDLARIRAGEPKYLLVELFRSLFQGLEPPPKVPFARPMDVWMASYAGPRDRHFKTLDPKAYTGDQRFLLHGLERFIALLGRDDTPWP